MICMLSLLSDHPTPITPLTTSRGSRRFATNICRWFCSFRRRPWCNRRREADVFSVNNKINAYGAAFPGTRNTIRTAQIRALLGYHQVMFMQLWRHKNAIYAYVLMMCRLTLSGSFSKSTALRRNQIIKVWPYCAVVHGSAWIASLMNLCDPWVLDYAERAHF